MRLPGCASSGNADMCTRMPSFQHSRAYGRECYVIYRAMLSGLCFEGPYVWTLNCYNVRRRTMKRIVKYFGCCCNLCRTVFFCSCKVHTNRLWAERVEFLIKAEWIIVNSKVILFNGIYGLECGHVWLRVVAIFSFRKCTSHFIASSPLNSWGNTYGKCLPKMSVERYMLLFPIRQQDPNKKT